MFSSARYVLRVSLILSASCGSTAVARSTVVTSEPEAAPRARASEDVATSPVRLVAQDIASSIVAIAISGDGRFVGLYDCYELILFDIGSREVRARRRIPHVPVVGDSCTSERATLRFGNGDAELGVTLRPAAGAYYHNALVALWDLAGDRLLTNSNTWSAGAVTRGALIRVLPDRQTAEVIDFSSRPPRSLLRAREKIAHVVATETHAAFLLESGVVRVVRLDIGTVVGDVTIPLRPIEGEREGEDGPNGTAYFALLSDGRIAAVGDDETLDLLDPRTGRRVAQSDPLTELGFLGPTWIIEEHGDQVRTRVHGTIYSVFDLPTLRGSNAHHSENENHVSMIDVARDGSYCGEITDYEKSTRALVLFAGGERREILSLELRHGGFPSACSASANIAVGFRYPDDESGSVDMVIVHGADTFETRLLRRSLDEGYESSCVAVMLPGASHLVWSRTSGADRTLCWCDDGGCTTLPAQFSFPAATSPPIAQPFVVHRDEHGVSLTRPNGARVPVTLGNDNAAWAPGGEFLVVVRQAGALQLVDPTSGVVRTEMRIPRDCNERRATEECAFGESLVHGGRGLRVLLAVTMAGERLGGASRVRLFDLEHGTTRDFDGRRGRTERWFVAQGPQTLEVVDLDSGATASSPGPASAFTFGAPIGRPEALNEREISATLLGDGHDPHLTILDAGRIIEVEVVCTTGATGCSLRQSATPRPEIVVENPVVSRNPLRWIGCDPNGRAGIYDSSSTDAVMDADLSCAEISQVSFAREGENETALIETASDARVFTHHATEWSYLARYVRDDQVHVVVVGANGRLQSSQTAPPFRVRAAGDARTAPITSP